jgi:hypothetical protein
MNSQFPASQWTGASAATAMPPLPPPLHMAAPAAQSAPVATTAVTTVPVAAPVVGTARAKTSVAPDTSAAVESGENDPKQEQMRVAQEQAQEQRVCSNKHQPGYLAKEKVQEKQEKQKQKQPRPSLQSHLFLSPSERGPDTSVNLPSLPPAVAAEESVEESSARKSVKPTGSGSGSAAPPLRSAAKQFQAPLRAAAEAEAEAEAVVELAMATVVPVAASYVSASASDNNVFIVSGGAAPNSSSSSFSPFVEDPTTRAVASLRPSAAGAVVAAAVLVPTDALPQLRPLPPLPPGDDDDAPKEEVGSAMQPMHVGGQKVVSSKSPPLSTRKRCRDTTDSSSSCGNGSGGDRASVDDKMEVFSPSKKPRGSSNKDAQNVPGEEEKVPSRHICATVCKANSAVDAEGLHDNHGKIALPDANLNCGNDNVFDDKNKNIHNSYCGVVGEYNAVENSSGVASRSEASAECNDQEEQEDVDGWVSAARGSRQKYLLERKKQKYLDLLLDKSEAEEEVVEEGENGSASVKTAVVRSRIIYAETVVCENILIASSSSRSEFHSRYYCCANRITSNKSDDNTNKLRDVRAFRKNKVCKADSSITLSFTNMDMVLPKESERLIQVIFSFFFFLPMWLFSCCLPITLE